MQQTIASMARQAKAAGRGLAALTKEKDRALAAIAESLWDNREAIFAANREDIAQSREENLAAPLLKRLLLDGQKLRETLDGVGMLAQMPSLVGETLAATELAPGLELYKVSCPIGVVGVIFESRPDALIQIACLCLKSGNACLLKGGREAARTNQVLFSLLDAAAQQAGVPAGWAGLLETREDVGEMLKMDDCIDLIIPRGSNEFVRYIMDNSRIPVLGHAAGICHVYVDKEADVPMAVRIAVDSKAQYVAVCNAMETLLVHEDIAAEFLPAMKAAMDAARVSLRGCSRTQAIIPVEPASEEDWAAEYLDYTLAVKVVPSLDDAVAHIHAYGSGHTDAIVTQSKETAAAFMSRVDSADVFHNCSTRFSDGYRFGLGAEVGVSTGKIHARGPMGIEGLLIYKYKLHGNGDLVADFAEGRRAFAHKKLEKDAE